jgi:hypothetical protein
MATMASCFSITSQIRDTFLVSKVEIDYEKLNKVEIHDLKIARKLSVITKEEFR